MKIDFRKITVEDIEGKKTTVDMSKDLGNAIYSQTKEIGEAELARDIYREGEVDITKRQAIMLKSYIEKDFLAFVQEAAIPALEIIINYVPKEEPTKK